MLEKGAVQKGKSNQESFKNYLLLMDKILSCYSVGKEPGAKVGIKHSNLFIKTSPRQIRLVGKPIRKLEPFLLPIQHCNLLFPFQFFLQDQSLQRIGWVVSGIISYCIHYQKTLKNFNLVHGQKELYRLFFHLR